MRYSYSRRSSLRDVLPDWFGLPTIGCGVAVLIVVGIVLGALLALRLTGFVHLLWMMLWLHPVGWTVFVATGTLITLAFVAGFNEWRFRWVLYTTAVLGFLFLVAYGFVSNGLYNKYLAQDQSPATLTSLTDANAVRWLPFEVAQQYGANRYQQPTTTLGDFQPIQTADGTIDWVAPREPNGFFNSLGTQQQGVAIIQTDGSVKLIDTPFKYGEGMLFANGYAWHLYERHYNVTLSAPYYVLSDNEVLMLVPYEGYKFEFPVMVPYWEGVFVVHANGTIEDLSSDKAISDPRFLGQRLFPEELARSISDAWSFRGGVLNAWFYHRDQVEIPTIDGSTNQMPYLLPTTDGPQWVVAAEPTGTSYGIFKVLVWDAHSGTMSVMSLPTGSSLIGPNRAARYVQSPLPQIQWKSDSGGKIILLEPRPVVRNGVLFWQLTVTTDDDAGVTFTVLVDSRSGDLRIFQTPDQLRGFLNGTYEGETPAQYLSGGGSTTGPTTATVDPSQMSNQQLIQLMKQIADELAKRNIK